MAYRSSIDFASARHPPRAVVFLEDPVGFEPTCRGLRIRRFPIMPRVLELLAFWSPGPATIRHHRVTKPAFCPLKLPGPLILAP